MNIQQPHSSPYLQSSQPPFSMPPHIQQSHQNIQPYHSKGQQIQPFLQNHHPSFEKPNQQSVAVHKSPLPSSDFLVFKRSQPTKHTTFSSTNNRTTNHQSEEQQKAYYTKCQCKCDCYNHASNDLHNEVIISSFRDEPRQVDIENKSNLYCLGCDQYLHKLTQIRKQNVKLELSVKKQKDQIQELKKVKNQLIGIIEGNRMMSIMKKDILHKQSIDTFKEDDSQVYRIQNMQVKDDLESQLFEQKFLNNLLMLQISQYSSPESTTPVSQLSNSSETNITVQKYESLLFENFKLQGQLITYKKIISDHQFYPIFHYNSRIQKLRSAVTYWYQVAMKDCHYIKKQILAFHQDHDKIKDSLIEQIKKEFNAYSNKHKSKIYLASKQFHSEYRESEMEINQEQRGQRSSQPQDKVALIRTRGNYKNRNNVGSSVSSNSGSKSQKNLRMISKKNKGKSLKSKLKEKKMKSIFQYSKESTKNAKSSGIVSTIQTKSKGKCSRPNCNANILHSEYIQVSSLLENNGKNENNHHRKTIRN